MSVLTYPEAIVIGALQGVTELLPVSSLGHSVLIPAIVGGSWARDLNVSTPESPYLSFIVGLHVATALALLVLFRHDWARIVRGFITSVAHRSVSTADERLAWLVIVATVPVGITGLLLEHTFRTTLGRPTPAAVFLTLNGVILLLGERLRRRAVQRERRPSYVGADLGNPATKADAGVQTGVPGEPAREQAGDVVPALEPAPGGTPSDVEIDARLATLGWRRAFVTGAAQCLALLPGISRSGVTMVAGLAQGLTHEEAVRLSFLLATPVILAAGVLKLPDLAGPLGSGIHGQILAGSLAAFVGAYLAARFLTRWFETRNLTPFAIYCLVAGPTALLLVNR
jgi:undecaprenyl-diphosphatase